MTVEVSERSSEKTIECTLLRHGPGACAGEAPGVREEPAPYGEHSPGGYRKRPPEEYDPSLCLLPRDVIDFVLATQPKEWEKLKQHHGAAVKEQFLKRLSREIVRRGTLDILRNGFKDSGCKFQMAFFRPSSGLNEALQSLHAANLFTVVRQLRYSEKTARSLEAADPRRPDTLPREVQQNIDMESYRIRQTGSGQLTPVMTKDQRGGQEELLEPLSQIIAELNDRFGLNLGPEHRLTLGQILQKLNEDAALDASARVNTRENIRLTFDHKVEDAVQEIVDSNFDLYKRITDVRAFGSALRDFLFDHYMRAHRQAEELIKRGESKTLEFKSTLRWNLRENKKDDKLITYSVLKTIAAFLNTAGGDLLIGVADDGTVTGIEQDRFENDDEFMRHLAQVVRNGLGDRASTCIDPKTQIVQGKTVCLVSCQRSPEPVFLRWKETEGAETGDFYVRSSPGSVKLSPESATEYIKTRFHK